jgi:stearoyl-CoA desaturase (delta-9 desaturase)
MAMTFEDGRVEAVAARARSTDYRVSKPLAWHLWIVVRDIALPTLGAVWVVVDTATGNATLFDAAMLLVAVAAGAMGLTVGLHRYFTHQAFEAHPALRNTLAALGTMVWERPLFAWVARHRLHHKLADSAGDYHSPHVYYDGTPVSPWWDKWLHAYYRWIHIADVNEETIRRETADLAKHPTLVWFDRNYELVCFLSIVAPGAVGWLHYGTPEGFLKGAMWGGFARVWILLQMTWIVNSACHLMGEATYDTGDHARNINLLGAIVFGEGYHNNHHAFPYSPRIGFDKGQIDLGWHAIQLCAWLGLAKNLTPIPDETARARRRRVPAA